MASVTLRNIRKRYSDTEVIKGIDLDINDREFVVFVGPSGCGKSTLMRMIAGLEDITSGDLLIDSKRSNDIPAADRGLAMVFQTYALYPHMTVAENMAFSLRLAGVPKAQRLQRAREVARILQLEPLLNRKPRELSGGQRQRVAIGRALVRSPKVFLFDEPLSNLDAALRVQMRIELARLHDSLQATMIYVTHDQIEAMTLADKIVVLQAGVIEQVGSPLELYHHPRNLFVAGFIGSPKMNFLSATVTGISEFEGVTITLKNRTAITLPVHAGGVKIGDAVTLGVRPEHLQLVGSHQTDHHGASSRIIQGEVLVAEHLGGETYLYLQMEGGESLMVKADGNNRSNLHDRVSVQIDRDTCHLFNLEGVTLPPLQHSAVPQSV
ncbi:sn-glycerol-3-phosphate ABC transporter ATP-binding protein UgpC [Leptolyngbya sp. ST-U4]|uniref:ABC transporter ATP-binding protein n=1 Tax=Leptolyngbya sp. ST-U4 TaxID=2933912 RepID=UPI0019CBD654|nr:sn-glycerol-3-phosphate ABC transporter ATP-binding protein UgpC [Cyanobacteria bacterium FACHB-502]